MYLSGQRERGKMGRQLPSPCKIGLVIKRSIESRSYGYYWERRTHRQASGIETRKPRGLYKPHV